MHLPSGIDKLASCHLPVGTAGKEHTISIYMTVLCKSAVNPSYATVQKFYARCTCFESLSERYVQSLSTTLYLSYVIGLKLGVV